jgi:CheY-like chemotaxis protein
MVVESHTGLQDVFRDKLKANGFRVLVTRDAERALSRFSDNPQPADCILFSSVELGEPALAAFNRLGDSEHTINLPAILLLGENQQTWLERAKVSDHRVVLQMPLKLRELRDTLTRLVAKK